MSAAATCSANPMAARALVEVTTTAFRPGANLRHSATQLRATLVGATTRNFPARR